MSELEALAEGLADQDAAVREDCARSLAELGDPQAVPYLLHALDDDEEQVRMWGAYGLGLVGDASHRALLERAAQEAEAPLLRIWAAFALVKLGKKDAAPLLLAGLSHATAAVRANAADALVSLDTPELLKAALPPLLEGPDEAGALWAAALLHRLRDGRGLQVWRHALGSPALRVDAAIAAPYMEDWVIARELLRVVGELPAEALEEEVGEDGARLAEVLTQPLLELPLDELLEQARTDEAILADLVLFAMRSPGADPELFDQIHAFMAGLDPAKVGGAAAEVLGEQTRDDWPMLLSNFAIFSTPALVPTLLALAEADREALLERAIRSVREDDDLAPTFFPLVDALREGPFAARLEGLPRPQMPTYDPSLEAEDDEAVSWIIRRMADGEEVSPAERKQAEALLAQVGLTAEEYAAALDESPQLQSEGPPDAETVARRALALGGLVRRVQLEEDARRTPAQRAVLQKALDALRAWVEEHALGVQLTNVELEQLNAGLGDWLEEELTTTAWAAEEAATLLWALRRAPSLPHDERTDARALVRDLPVGKPPGAWLGKAEVRSGEELEAKLSLFGALRARLEQEALARQIKAEGLEGTGLEADSLLAGAVEDGFDRKAAEKAHGKNGAVAEALRFVGRLLARHAEEQGLIKLAGEDFPLKGKSAAAATDPELAVAVAVVAERQRALTWLLTGTHGDDAGALEEEEEDEAVR